MAILAVETSSARGSLALLRVSGPDDGLVEELVFPEGLVHGRELALRTEELMRRHDLKPSELEGVAVSCGPGSYTGIRVGVTAAKSLAFALNCAVIPVSSLEVIAANADRPSEGEGDRRGDICVILDGRQGHLYRALFRFGDAESGDGLVRALDDEVVDLERLRAGELPGVSAPAFLIADGADLALETLADAARELERGPRDWDLPGAFRLGQIALRRWRKGDVVRDRGEIHALEPSYLRPSEAERRLAEKSMRGS